MTTPGREPPGLDDAECRSPPVRSVVDGAWFCENPGCVLRVQAGLPGTRGAGEWAVRPDGVITSRARYGARVLCDLCGLKARRGG